MELDLNCFKTNKSPSQYLSVIRIKIRKGKKENKNPSNDIVCFNNSFCLPLDVSRHSLSLSLSLSLSFVFVRERVFRILFMLALSLHPLGVIRNRALAFPWFLWLCELQFLQKFCFSSGNDPELHVLLCVTQRNKKTCFSELERLCVLTQSFLSYSWSGQLQ